MNIRALILAGIAAAALAGVQAQAATFTKVAFSATAYDGIPASHIEDFESYTAGTWNEATVTNVGTFEALAEPGLGSGSTCSTLGGDCSQLFLSDIPVNGQGNITPADGSNALQANDTYGMVWNAFGATDFTEILFGIRDAADQGATVTVSLLGVNGGLLAPDNIIQQSFSGLPNSGQYLISLSLLDTFGGAVSSAMVSIVSSKLNDSFTLDGAALKPALNGDPRFNPVPLPGAAWLFLSVLGGAGILRRARATS